MGIMGILREAFYEAKYSDHPDYSNAPIVKALKEKFRYEFMHTVRMISLSAFRFAEEFNLDLRIEHCTEGHLIADELSGHEFKSFSWTYTYKKI